MYSPDAVQSFTAMAHLNSAQQQVVASAVGSLGANALARILGLHGGLTEDYVSVPSAAEPTKAIVSSSRSSGSRGGSGKRGYKMKRNSNDLKVKPPSQKTPMRLPKNIPSSVFFDVTTMEAPFTINPTFSEYGAAWSFQSNHPQFAQYVLIFDQWFIHSVDVTFRTPQSPGSTQPEVIMHTALDFDNVSALGSLQGIDNYDTCQVTTLGPGSRSSVLRSVVPCFKVQTTQSNTGTLSRNWCDSASPTTAWYGIRAAAVLPGASSTQIITVDTRIFWGFRGRI